MFLKKYSIEVIIILFIASIICYAYFPLLNGEFIVNYSDYYFDWMNQGFRTTILKTYGLTSWQHNVDNGQNMWTAYQFIPHYMTIWTSNILGLSIAKTMQILIIVLAIFMHVTIYLAARNFNARRLISLIYAIGLLGMLQLNAIVYDYTTFWGLALIPIYIWQIVKYANNWKIINTLTISALFYIHPIAGFFISGYLALIALSDFYIAAKYSESESNGIHRFSYYSQNRILLKKWISHLIVFLLTTSFYWLPALFYQGTQYTDKAQINTSFIRNMLYPVNFGFSYSLLTLIAFTSIIIILNVKKILKKENLSILVLILACLILLFFYIITFYYELPSILNSFQIVRWMPFMVLSFLISSSILISQIFKKFNIQYFILIVIFSWLLIENLSKDSYTSFNRLIPTSINITDDPTQQFLKNHAEYNLSDGIFIDNIPQAQYFNMGKIKTERGYFHFSQNKLRNAYIEFRSHWQNLPDPENFMHKYLAIRGVKYIITSEDYGEDKIFDPTATQSYNYEKIDEITHLGRVYYVLENKDLVFKNLLIDTNSEDYEKLKKIGTQNLTAINTATKYMNEFYEILHKNAKSLNKNKIDYSVPAQIKIDSIPANKTIIINTNFDINWEIQNLNLEISELGTGYLGVTNKSNQNISNIELTHKKDTSESISLYTTIIVGTLALIWSFVQLISKTFKH